MAAIDSSIQVKVTRFGDRKYLLAYYDDPITGRRISKSTKQTSQKEAEKFAAKWEAELQEGRYKPKSNVTWDEFREQFLAHLQDSPAATYSAYCSSLNAFEREVSVKKLADVTTLRIDYAAKKWREGDDAKSIETVETYLRHLKAALNWAVSNGLLNAAPKINMPKRQRGQKLMKGRPITAEEFERMLGKIEDGILACGLGKPNEKAKWRISEAALKDKREAQVKIAKQNAPNWERLLCGLWLSGLRIGEALNLSWDDEDKILVDLSGKRPMLRIYAHQQKGGRDTLLPITPDFAEFLLQRHKAERTGPVFPLPGKRGEQIIDSAYAGRVISAIGEAAGVVVDKASGKFASAHDLRRAFGFRWAMRVMPAVLKELMRHADISTTMKYYVGQNAEAMADEIWAAADPNSKRVLQAQ